MPEPHPSPESRVLVIEDHAKVGESLRRRLTNDGNQVTLTASGEEGRVWACSGTYDVVVLDLMLPGIGGLEILREMRSRNVRTPVLVLTARDSVSDRLRGLDGGADDYLVKPFAMPELVARIRALLRRSRQPDIRRLRIADLELDLITRQAARNGRAIDLAPREFELLAYLVSHAGHVVSREMLGRDVWVQLERGTPLDNVIDVHIGRLRRKVDHDGQIPLIQTVRGLGFTVSKDLLQ
jgi:two-component system copper resistance phosphate regulon response regulator CusR